MKNKITVNDVIEKVATTKGSPGVPADVRVVKDVLDTTFDHGVLADRKVFQEVLKHVDCDRSPIEEILASQHPNTTKPSS